MRAFNPKIIAGIFTAMILALLVVAGPAEAFILDMSLSDDKPAAGESVTFDVSTEVESADAPADVSFFTLLIKHENKKDVISCSFTPDGEILSDCPGITIVKKSSAPVFGYGYGYSGFGAGKFAFDIILDTTGIKHGAYRTFFIANVAGEEFEKEGKKLIISERKEKDDDENEDEQEREDDEDENEHQNKEEKIKVCHVPQGNPSNAHTIEIGSSALQTHLAHGDSIGECPEPEEQHHDNEGNHNEDNDHDDQDHEDHHENNEQSNDNNDKPQKNDNSNNGKGKGKK